MADGIYTALSGAVARERQLEVLANNLANVTTTGYKSDRLSFEEVLQQNTLPDPQQNPVNGKVPMRWAPLEARFTRVAETTVSMLQGTIHETGNPLDVAIEGEGFFGLGTADGVRYSRNGQFWISEDGFLVSREGNFVLDTNGNEISPLIGEDGVTIEPDGSIKIGPNRSVQVGLWNLGNRAIRQGESLFGVEGEEPLEATNNQRLVSGAVEGSNVNPLRLMVELIEVQRSFETLNTLMQTSRQMDGKVASEVGRLA